MLDMLPQELFSSPDTKFLDPAVKTGVYPVKKRIVTILLQKSMMPVCMDRITSLAELPIGRLVIRTCVK